LFEPTEAVPSSEETSPLGALRAFLILLAFFAAQLAAAIVVGLAGGIWFAVMRGDAGPAVMAEAQRAVLMPAALVGTIVGGLVALGLTWLTLRGTGDEGWRAIGWSGASRRDVLLAGLAGLGFGAFYVFGLAPLFPPTPGYRWGPVAQAVSAGGWPRHAWVALALVVAPPVEEFIFRGVLFAGFARSWSAASAGTLVTLIFLAGHLTEAWGYAPALLAIVTVGAAALFARILTNSLVPAVALHAAYNFVLGVSLYSRAA
jgi:membrane protease YdiL (CAAX protease family)